jgi:hypothetical protein
MLIEYKTCLLLLTYESWLVMFTLLVLLNFRQTFVFANWTYCERVAMKSPELWCIVHLVKVITEREREKRISSMSPLTNLTQLEISGTRDHVVCFPWYIDCPVNESALFTPKVRSHLCFIVYFAVRNDYSGSWLLMTDTLHLITLYLSIFVVFLFIWFFPFVLTSNYLLHRCRRICSSDPVQCYCG